MKLFFLSLLFLCLQVCCLHTNAQTIKGQVTADGVGVPGVNILIKAGDSAVVEQFSITNTEGFYSITLKKKYAFIFFEASALGYRPYSLRIENVPHLPNPYELHVKLISQPLHLDEIVIRAAKEPITIKKDTATYNIEVFKDGTERIIEDLLKKLPGIEVEKNGTIKFKGKAISKMLLDGDDLFSQKYTIGSKNLDVDIVEQVQAIENYNQNPLLSGIMDSDEVAINLVLKKGKADISGNMDIGYGIENRYNLGATLLGITNNFKTFALSKYNNIGINSSPYNLTSAVFSPQATEDLELIAPRIINEGSFNSPLEDRRSLFNSSLYNSFNAIYRPSKKISTKINLDYYLDALRRNNIFQTDFYVDDVNLRVTQAERIEKLPQLLNGQVDVTFLPSVSTSLEYTGQINFIDSKTNLFVNNNGRQNSTQIKTENIFIKNKFALTKRLNDLNALKITALQSYSSIPQSLISDQDIEFYFRESTLSINNQNSRFSKEYFELEGALHSNSSYGQLKLSAGFRVVNDALLSSIEVINSDNNEEEVLDQEYRNNNNYRAVTPFIASFFQYNIGKFSFKPSLKLEYYSGRLDDVVVRKRSELEKLLLVPAVSVSYKANSNSAVYAAYRYSQDLPLMQRLYRGFIVDSYRSISNNDVDLDLINTHSTSLGYNINDFYNLFNLSVDASIIWQDKNILLGQDISKFSNQLTYLLQDAGVQAYQVNGALSKYIHSLRTTFKAGSSHGIFKYQNIINGSEIRNNESRFHSYELFSKTGFQTKLNFEHKISIQTNKVYSAENVVSVSSLKNNVRFIYEPAKSWSVISDVYQFVPNTDYGSTNVHFLDLAIAYTMPDQKTVITLSGVNLTNSKVFNQAFISDYSQSVGSFNLIERYLMLSANIKL